MGLDSRLLLTAVCEQATKQFKDDKKLQGQGLLLAQLRRELQDKSKVNQSLTEEISTLKTAVAKY